MHLIALYLKTSLRLHFKHDTFTKHKYTEASRATEVLFVRRYAAGSAEYIVKIFSSSFCTLISRLISD